MLLIALLACASDPLLDEDGGDDVQPTPDAVCLEDWVDGVFEPDPDGPDTQIHGTGLFVHGQLWVASNRVDDNGKFDVWLTSVDCTGSTVVAPLELTASDDNELDPVLVQAAGDGIVVAWTSEDGSGSDNLDIRTRSVSAQGQPLGSPAELTGTRSGQAVTGNATLPALASTDSRVVLAESWGHDDAPAFQAFAMELDGDSQPVGQAQDVDLDTEFGQLYVDVLADGLDTWLAWQEDSTTSTQPTVERALLGQPAERLAQPAARPSLAWSSDGIWTAWDTDDGTVQVLPPGGDVVDLDLGSGFFHSVDLASTGGPPTLVVMEVDSGIYNKLHVARLDADGAVSWQQELDADGAPSVYGVDLSLLDDTHAAVVWQEGDSPAFRMRAQLVTLE